MVPLAEEKIEGPSTKFEVLGIIINTESMQLSLSEARMKELRSLLQNCGQQGCNEGRSPIAGG